MLPLRDSQPSRRFPLITVLLIAVNLLIFIYQSTLDEPALYHFFERYAFTSRGLFEALGAGQFYWPLFTSMFLHGGVGHLVGNMWILWLFGDNVEDYLGPWRYILFYLGTGLIALPPTPCRICSQRSSHSEPPAPSRVSWAPTWFFTPMPAS